jgi:hypothetical protein
MAARLWPTLLVACTLACSACGAGTSARPKVTYSAAEGVQHTPPAEQAARTAAPERVELRALSAPPVPHVIVGRLVARADDDDHIERDGLMQGLRRRAAELGCDAVLLEPPFEEQRRVRFRHDHLVMTKPVLHGACIVYE